MGVRYFGAKVPRVEDPDLLTGCGRYLDDIHLPGMLEAAFVRSPHAHARIRGIDKAAAEALPGVVAVLTASDLDAAERRAAIMRGRFGNVDEAFARAPHVFRERMFQTRGGCHAMECRGVVTVQDALSGQLTVFSSTQAPYMVRRALAGWMGLDES